MSDTAKAPEMSREQAERIAEKIAQLVGQDGPFEQGQQRNERGELLNEEGLPIIDITEPLNKAFAQGVPILQAEVDAPIPASSLSPAERARRKLERDRILDSLEEEEQLEAARNEELEAAERRESLRRRREAAKGELENLKAAKEMHKKMGKALLQNMAHARKHEEKNTQEQPVEKPKSLNPKKSVTFAESTKEEQEDTTDEILPGVDWGDVAPARLRAPTKRGALITKTQISTLPMKMDVIERINPAPPRPEVDSDDESVPPDSPQDSEDEEPAHPYKEDDPSLLPRPIIYDSDEDQPELEEEEYDLDVARHRREIALEYYEKRVAIGAETREAMSAHTHIDGEDDWHQEEVPLDATLATAQPKSGVSKFKANRLAASYNYPPTCPPNSAPTSQSIGPSIIPASRIDSIQRAVRIGKLQEGKLVGGVEGDSASEEEEDTMKEVLELLRKGDVHNIGQDSPQQKSHPSATTPPVPSTSRVLAKDSKFKLARSQAGRPSVVAPSPSPLSPGSALSASFLSPSMTPPCDAQRSSPKLPETSTLSPTPAIDYKSMMVIDSPSFMPPAPPPPQQARKINNNVVSAPSFHQEREPISGERLDRPPTIMASAVRESLPNRAQKDATAETADEARPGRKVSRFLAERQ